jgi:hypothetical protein
MLLLQTTPVAGEKVRPHSPRPSSLTLSTDIMGRVRAIEKKGNRKGL